MKFLFFLLPLITFADTVKDREGAVRSDREKMTNQDRWIYNDTDQAFAKAAREKRPVLVVLRCVPCLACAGLDGSITEAPALSPLLDQFVCLRLINTNSLDLNRFQFDYDLSLAALVLNSDGTTYGRFGSWKHQKDPTETSVAGFKTALTSALALHKNYPSNKTTLADKQPRPLGFKTPLQIPFIAESQRNFKPELDWEGKVVQSCVHCHQIGDGLKSTFHDRGKTVPLQLSHPMPTPETIGISLAGDKRATITVVQPDSAASKAGLKVGDEIITAKKAPLISPADLAWSLHHLKDEDTLPLTVKRNGSIKSISLTLAKDWRLQSDISRRVGTWPMRAWIGGGMKLESVPGDHIGLRATHVGQYNQHAAAKRAGFKKGDILIEVDGIKERKTESQLFGILLQRHPKPTTLDATVLRNGKRISLKFPIQ
ncbi:MAG: Trx7/PDZ domain-containing (seleno)protein [Akkermansiaceae bacterium]|nr:Trx7/PDZ domain-containing (seleno)protein [Akkermansiaceae bacterium]